MTVSQNDRMLALLRQRPHSSWELAVDHGIGRPNSRRSELIKQGHDVTCEFHPEGSGASRWVYGLIVPLGESAARTVVADSPSGPFCDPACSTGRGDSRGETSGLVRPADQDIHGLVVVSGIPAGQLTLAGIA